MPIAPLTHQELLQLKSLIDPVYPPGVSAIRAIAHAENSGLLVVFEGIVKDAGFPQVERCACQIGADGIPLWQRVALKSFSEYEFGRANQPRDSHGRFASTGSASRYLASSKERVKTAFKNVLKDLAGDRDQKKQDIVDNLRSEWSATRGKIGDAKPNERRSLIDEAKAYKDAADILDGLSEEELSSYVSEARKELKRLDTEEQRSRYFQRELQTLEKNKREFLDSGMRQEVVDKIFGDTERKLKEQMGRAGGRSSKTRFSFAEGEYKLYFFKNRRTGIVARSVDEARKKLKRGGPELVKVRALTESERKIAARGEWVRSGPDPEKDKPGYNPSKRGMGPKPKDYAEPIALQQGDNELLTNDDWDQLADEVDDPGVIRDAMKAIAQAE